MKKVALVFLLFIGALGALRAETAEARLQSTSTHTYVSGVVTFEETPQGLKVLAMIDKAPPGPHGFHIHEYGSCDDFGNKAGGHYNPEGQVHGHAVKDGPKKAHPGDMGNIQVGPDGKGRLDIVLSKVALLSGNFPVAGRAIILHAKPDDYSQPTGNAGGRIGCGPIVITGK